MPKFRYAGIVCRAALTGIEAVSTLTLDSGASVCVTNNCSDFVTYCLINQNIRSISIHSKVADEGTVCWRLHLDSGLDAVVELHEFHIPPS